MGGERKQNEQQQRQVFCRCFVRQHAWRKALGAGSTRLPQQAEDWLSAADSVARERRREKKEDAEGSTTTRFRIPCPALSASHARNGGAVVRHEIQCTRVQMQARDSRQRRGEGKKEKEAGPRR